MNTNICMSNPEARSIMAKYIADYAEKQNNVDFLHIWLADGSNNHCECEECRKKVTSDWYIMLLNDIDAELTRRNLDTHLVFIVYVDTFWPPLEQKLNNHKRFTMLFAPITRLYTETYGEEADASKVVPYDRNKTKRPRGMAECLAYLHEWKKTWPGDCFCYEYHFMDFQYMDISNMFMSKILYDDIVAQKKQGLNGIVEDGSQRSYFPTGFQFYVYGETLYDSSVSFEELKEDYFSHAYGENWKAVVEYLEGLRDAMDFSYFFGINSADESKGKFYNPAMLEKTARAKQLAADFAPVIKANKNQEYRASTVAWQLLEEHLAVVNYIADMIAYKCVGDNENAVKVFDEMQKAMSEREIYIERYYDHWLFTFTMSIYTEGLRKL